MTPAALRVTLEEISAQIAVGPFHTDDMKAAVRLAANVARQNEEIMACPHHTTVARQVMSRAGIRIALTLCAVCHATLKTEPLS